MRVVKLSAKRTIRLPKRFFKPEERVAIFSEGSTFIIKKIEAPRLSEIAARVSEPPMPMREVVREVRAYRRARQNRSR